MDARGKFGDHDKDALERNSSFEVLSKLPKCMDL